MIIAYEKDGRTLWAKSSINDHVVGQTSDGWFNHSLLLELMLCLNMPGDVKSEVPCTLFSENDRNINITSFDGVSLHFSLQPPS